MRWFRLYDEILDDPKVQRLPGDLFKLWVNLLAVASRHDGVIPAGDLPFILRMPEARVLAGVRALVERDLLDDREEVLAPHNWTGRQFQSDDSAERVRRLRARRRAADSNGACNVTSPVTDGVAVTGGATPPESETESETDSPPKSPLRSNDARAVPERCGRSKAPTGLAAVAAAMMTGGQDDARDAPMRDERRSDCIAAPRDLKRPPCGPPGADCDDGRRGRSRPRASAR